MKNLFKIKDFGLNYKRINFLYKKFGISIIQKTQLTGDILDNINKFLIVNLVKKDIILKDRYLKTFQYIENGSLKGYRKIRGLPLFNQKTKTNAKTARKK